MKAIHMEQKYQEADNIVTFNHVMCFTMGPREVRAKSSFSTVFGSTMLDWDIHLHKQFAGRAVSVTNWGISLFGVGMRDLYPPLRRLQFTLNMLDAERNTLKSLKYFIDGSMDLTASNRRTPRGRREEWKEYQTNFNTPFAKQLRELMTESGRKDQEFQLETRLEFSKTDFLDVKYLVGEGAVPVDEMREYYFDAIVNRSRHDLKLLTSNGSQSVMINKEILSLSSPFFCQQLKESTTELTVTIAEMIESIEICLVYLLTSRYKRPPHLSPRLALEVFQLAVQWKVFEPKILKNSLERQCYEELVKNHENFMYVCNMLLIAEDAPFVNIQNCCVAVLIHYHFNEFVRLFINGTHPLKERFTQRREFLRPSLTMQVKRGFAASNDVRTFVKYLPLLGQD